MIKRRDILAGGAAVAAVGIAASASRPVANQSAPDKKPPFVLVHGTWHGGWVWRDVKAQLQAAGHEVYTPTCTGCGEREHLCTPEVGLDTHIEDIANVLRFNELEDVILVGHSYSGLTITGVADREKERIRRIVFFDALVPHGDVMSAVPRDAQTGEYPEWWRARQSNFRNGYQMNLWDDYPVEMLVPAGQTEHIARLKKLITTHPARQWTDELVLDNGGWEGLNPAYIHCVGQEYRLSSDRMVGPAKGPGWTYIGIDAPRNAMMTHPDLTADTLLSLV